MVYRLDFLTAIYNYLEIGEREQVLVDFMGLLSENAMTKLEQQGAVMLKT